MPQQKRRKLLAKTGALLGKFPIPRPDSALTSRPVLSQAEISARWEAKPHLLLRLAGERVRSIIPVFPRGLPTCR